MGVRTWAVQVQQGDLGALLTRRHCGARPRAVAVPHLPHALSHAQLAHAHAVVVEPDTREGRDTCRRSRERAKTDTIIFVDCVGVVCCSSQSSCISVCCEPRVGWDRNVHKPRHSLKQQRHTRQRYQQQQHQQHQHYCRSWIPHYLPASTLSTADGCPDSLTMER